MFEPAVRDDVLRVLAPGARWLSTGVDGGFSRADAAYNLTVPDGFDRRDVGAYVAERRRRAGYDAPGPALLTGVSMAHARGARSGTVVAYATAGLSNPAALPMDPDDEPGSGSRTSSTASASCTTSTSSASPASSTSCTSSPSSTSSPTSTSSTSSSDARPPDGTVNLVLGTSRALDDGALADLLAVAVEAKAATLLAVTGFPGTTTDAAVVGCDPEGEPAAFSGSGTPVGADARACVREAVRGSLRSRYPDGGTPETANSAEHGVRTDRRAEVFRP